MRILLIAALLAVTPAARVADAPTRAVLADAADAPVGRVIIDGATWRCDGAACTATGGANQPAPRACRRVKARLGPLVEFAWKGEALTGERLAACNA